MTVRNNGPQVNDLTVRAVTSDGRVTQVESNGGQTIQPYSGAQFEIAFPGAVAEEVSGSLVLEASDVIPAVQSLTLQPAPAARTFLGMSQMDAGHVIALGFRVGLGVFVLATLAVALGLTSLP